MKKLLFYLMACFFLSFAAGKNLVAQKTVLTNHWDTIRPLVNPNKGWYHHMLDNGIGKYLIQDENDLNNFPGMDHLYLRLAWAFLEPKEGKWGTFFICINCGAISWAKAMTMNDIQ